MLISSCNLPCTFLVAKEKTWKRIFNTNSELSQNRAEKQSMLSKTAINWLFNDVWCYLFIAWYFASLHIQSKCGKMQEKWGPG